MPVIREETRAQKGLSRLRMVPDEAGLYSRKFMIESTSLCNLKCPLCPVPAHLHRNVGHMQKHTFEQVIDDLVGYAKKIDFWNFGEPFLNPDFFDMVKYATDRGIKIRVSTNSTFLEDEQVEKIFWSNLSSIIVCLDGASKQTHERYRIGSEFEKVVEGINRLAQRKRGLGRELPFIRLQFLVFSYNEHEIDDIIEMAEHMQVDQLALKNVSLGTWIEGAIRKKIAKKLLPKEDKFRKYSVTGEEIALKIEDSACSWAYENGVVLSNGDVTTCCYDSSGEHVFANVHRDGGLLRILQSDLMKEVRDQIKRRELPLCQTCQYSDYGATLINFHYNGNGNGKTNSQTGRHAHGKGNGHHG